jgi:two-component system cell cycle response regulator
VRRFNGHLTPYLFAWYTFLKKNAFHSADLKIYSRNLKEKLVLTEGKLFHYREMLGFRIRRRVSALFFGFRGKKGGNMSGNITIEKLKGNLDFFSKMYDVVRLVDPVKKLVIDHRDNGILETNEICHDYWKNGKICDNCISVRAFLENDCFLKLERTPDLIMMVTAMPIEKADSPTVLELLKNATETMMMGSGTYSEGRLMQSVVAEMNNMVIRDEMTGLYNRRYVNERLPADIVQAVLAGQPLSVIFIDLDNFKEINDTYGHAVGDQAIIGVTKVLVSCIRDETDWISRFGWDEFFICLNNASRKQVYTVAERIRRKISEAKISEKKITTYVSIGVYTMEDLQLTPDALIGLADKRMYQAKQRGKNCIVAD